MKEYGKVKAFRLQAAEETKLEECFDWLQVSGDNFNQRMNDFIAKVYTFLSQNAADHKAHPVPAKGSVKEHAEDRDLYKRYAKDFQTEREIR